jgi:hypothetical protein
MRGHTQASCAVASLVKKGVLSLMRARQDRDKGVNRILHMVLAKKRVHSFMCAQQEPDKEGVHPPLSLKVILKKVF